MPNIHPRFVVDENDEKQAVLLTFDEWRQILDDLEELDEIREYDKAKAGPQDAMPFDQAMREIEEAG